MQEEFDDGEQILDSATYIFPEVALTWTLLGESRVEKMRCDLKILKNNIIILYSFINFGKSKRVANLKKSPKYSSR